MADNKEKINLTDIWPQERDFIARPERYKYVRKLIHSKDCVFCKALAAGVCQESLVVYKDSSAMVILNKYPYNSGHILVLPVRHTGHFKDLSGEEYQNLMAVLRASFNIIEESYECSGVNMGLNHGKVAGAGIPEHLHWHIIPRFYGDTNFFPLIAETKVLPESLEQTYARLAVPFKALQEANS